MIKFERQYKNKFSSRGYNRIKQAIALKIYNFVAVVDNNSYEKNLWSIFTKSQFKIFNEKYYDVKDWTIYNTTMVIFMKILFNLKH